MEPTFVSEGQSLLVDAICMSPGAYQRAIEGCNQKTMEE